MRQALLSGSWLRWLPLLLIVILIMLSIHNGLYDLLSFATLKKYHQTWLAWRTAHYGLSLLLFAASYTLAVAVSLPGASLLTLTGGLLFGPVIGSIVVILSATLGATLVFLAVKFSLGTWLAQQTSAWLRVLRHGLQENAFAYLLFLRLVPLFPFWVVNLVPALLGVRTFTFTTATFLGILPGTVIYCYLGHGLSRVFASQQTLHWHVLFDPWILYPLLGFAGLTLLPVIYRKCLQKKTPPP